MRKSRRGSSVIDAEIYMFAVDKSIIALDYGQRRVGVAGCRGDVPISFGITTLIIDNLGDLISQLLPILEERSPGEIIIGFPLTLGDKPGTLKSEVLKVGGYLRDRGYTVRYVDEALSSRRAGEILKKREKRSKREDYDRAAAALILQEYLDGNLVPLSEDVINPSCE